MKRRDDEVVSPEQVSVPPPGMLPRRVLISVGPADERRTGTTQLVAHASRHSITPLRSYSALYGPDTMLITRDQHATRLPVRKKRKNTVKMAGLKKINK